MDVINDSNLLLSLLTSGPLVHHVDLRARDQGVYGKASRALTEHRFKGPTLP